MSRPTIDEAAALIRVPDEITNATYVIDKDNNVWKITRDGGMAVKAEHEGITSIGINVLMLHHGPLIPFDPMTVSRILDVLDHWRFIADQPWETGDPHEVLRNCIAEVRHAGNHLDPSGPGHESGQCPR